MAERRKKRPRDPVALAKPIGDIATGQVEDREDDSRDADAVELGRRGGLKGGRAQAEALSADGGSGGCGRCYGSDARQARSIQKAGG